jgi:hypothetical protein
MKTFYIGMVFFLIGGIVNAQKTVINDPNASVRNNITFHAIEVSNAINLYLSQGNEETVAVSAKRQQTPRQNSHGGKRWRFKNLVRQ